MADLPDNLRELAEKRAVGSFADEPVPFTRWSEDEIKPGRGGTSFALGFDEMAHIPAKGSGSGRSIADIIEESRQAYLDSMIEVPWANHPIIASANNMICTAREWTARRGASVLCGEHAAHKIGEEGADPTTHNLTTYVCCEHFRSLMGSCR